MNKTELIAAAAEKAGLSKKDTEAVITATLASITEALQNDDKVQLVGFFKYGNHGFPPWGCSPDRL